MFVDERPIDAVKLFKWGSYGAILIGTVCVVVLYYVA
jgi:hypothetical protein